jgi:bla regulator protein BlaR1
MSVLLILITTAVKSLGLLILAMLFSALTGKKRARVRAVIWSSALVGALLLPLLGAFGPKLFIGIPAWLAHESTISKINAVPAKSAVGSNKQIHIAPSTPMQPKRTSHIGWMSIEWMSLLPIIWLTGFCMLSIRQLAGWLRIVITLHRSQKLDASWDKILSRSMRRVGCRRRPRLVVSNNINTPATAFMFHPIILLPERCANWLIERQEIVLQHELVHINRYDWIVRELAHLACSVYWFNPLAWWGLRCLVYEQEKACDEEVVASGTRPSSYAATLLELARAATGQPMIPVLEIAHNRQLEGRIMRVLNHGCRTPRRAILLTAIVVFGFVFTPLS